jgi:hypothetical protein
MVLSLLVLLFGWGAVCYAGQSSTGSGASLVRSTGVAAKSVTILSEPTAASIFINDQFVGKTPCVVDVAVNSAGQCVKHLEIRAQKPPTVVYRQTRVFPGENEDGRLDNVPSVLYFDLFVQRVVTIR